MKHRQTYKEINRHMNRLAVMQAYLDGKRIEWCTGRLRRKSYWLGSLKSLKLPLGYHTTH
jgi:hypothetical protein